MAERRRNFLGAIVALAATLLTFAVHQRLFRPPAPASPEYAVTGLVLANYTWGVAVVLFAVGVGVGYALRATPVAAGAGLILVEAGATCYEIARFPTSHNLLPFDLIGWVVMASPLALGALLGRRLRRRAGSGGLTSG
jgi:hypothetical protein